MTELEFYSSMVDLVHNFRKSSSEPAIHALAHTLVGLFSVAGGLIRVEKNKGLLDDPNDINLIDEFVNYSFNTIKEVLNPSISKEATH